MSRTNVEIDDELIGRAMRRYGYTTKEAVVAAALQRMDSTPMDTDEALALHGSGWDGDLDAMRTDIER